MLLYVKNVFKKDVLFAITSMKQYGKLVKLCNNIKINIIQVKNNMILMGLISKIKMNNSRNNNKIKDNEKNK